MTVIIGGGSAGLYYACLLKESDPDEEVIVVEEHTAIGKPVQCTGILTDDMDKLIPADALKKITVNRITKTAVFSPNDSVTIPIKANYIIDNVGLILYLSERAEKAGVKIMTGKKYVENRGPIITLRDTATKEIIQLNDNRIIGADGPASDVAKNNHLYAEKRKFLTGVQARVRLENLDEECIEFYPYIGEYAWSTPEGNNISRIGVAAESNAKKIFDEFIKKYPGKILEMQGGPIPMHRPNMKLRYKNKEFSVTLLGDAALQIKNTTGGGIIPGMKAAKILARDFGNYEKNLKILNRELKVHYLLNKSLVKYNPKQWDSLIRKVKDPKIMDILKGTNRDNAAKIMLRLATRPSMILEGLRAVTKLI